MGRGRVAAVVLVGLAACGAPDAERAAAPGGPAVAPVGEGSSAAAAPARDAPREGTVVGPDSVVRYGYRILDYADVDVDGDGEPERLELGATVERAPDGRPLWEDGHHWLVRVRHGGDAYLLLQEFVPWGTAAVWTVAGGEADGSSAILVQVRSGFGGNVGTRLDRWAHDPAAGGYVRTGSVGASGTGVHLSAPP